MLNKKKDSLNYMEKLLKSESVQLEADGEQNDQLTVMKRKSA